MRCTAGITINGKNYGCKHDISTETYTHPPKHEAVVTDEDGHGGLNVGWSYWRMVKPAASGGSINTEGVSH